MGVVSDSNVVSTTAGQLHFKAVYHAVIPTWHGGLSNETDLLKKTIFNCLALANDNNFTSIAFPPIGKGMFKYPVEHVAKTLCQTIKAFLKLDNYKTKLKKVVICDRDENSYDCFIQHLEQQQFVKLRSTGMFSKPVVNRTKACGK